MQLKRLNKKGQITAGMNTVQAVMVSFLIIAVISIAIMLGLSSLRDAVEKADIRTSNIVNFTTETVNDSTSAVLPALLNLRNCQLTAVSVVNQTENRFMTSGNYTTSGCTIRFSSTSSADAGKFNNTLWNVTGSYTDVGPETNNLVNNLSLALTDFFSDTGTIFSILIVVLIILAISIIIAVVTRFQSGGSIGGGREGGGQINETVMGV